HVSLHNIVADPLRARLNRHANRLTSRRLEKPRHVLSQRVASDQAIEWQSNLLRIPLGKFFQPLVLFAHDENVVRESDVSRDGIKLYDLPYLSQEVIDRTTTHDLASLALEHSVIGMIETVGALVGAAFLSQKRTQAMLQHLGRRVVHQAAVREGDSVH